MRRDRLTHLLIPLAAFLAVLLLLLQGCSCGHDFEFHLLSWMEAARQFTQGNLHPHWAYTPAWNAGEPRFVFYPPASWTLGAILGLILSWPWTPIVYTWLALTASGFALHRLARDFAGPTAALLASVFYLANPYMLFTAYERTAYAELLAAAWIPLLLHAILRRQVTIPSIAIPVALLWLTNAPAAVMSCYALALLTLVRLLHPSDPLSAPQPNSSEPPKSVEPSKSVISTGATHGLIVSRAVEKPASLPLPPPRHPQTRLDLALRTIAGTTLGLGLAAFYVLPAAYERRFVQIRMALIPGMRFQDSFLFHHTGDIPHDEVLHTASVIAILLLVGSTITLLIAARQAKKPGAPYLDSEMWASREMQPPLLMSPQTYSANSSSQPDCRQPLPAFILTSLAILILAILLLLTPISAFLWNHVPELDFLQFPWRLLAILAAVLAFTLALALTRLHLKPAVATAIALWFAATLIYPAYNTFQQDCEPQETVPSRLAHFHSNQGVEPTDEYTPTSADNDSLAHANPAYWLSPNPDAKAPANLPPGPAPTHLTLNSPIPQTLILNLRNYPAWRITLNHTPVLPLPDERDDGLIALPIPAGPSTIDLSYTQTLDQTLGDSITLLSFCLLLLTFRSNVLPDGPPTLGTPQTKTCLRPRFARSLRDGYTRHEVAIYHRHQMHPTVQNLLLSGAELTDAALERLLPSPDTLPHSIHRAMRHSTFAGGKRLRPILCMEAARMVASRATDPLEGTPKSMQHPAPKILDQGPASLPEGAADLGAALEMLHTYSLIHDDLPALDNDDLRRGQPTCHVLFGQATAILAGDALQTLAFQTIAALPCPPAATVAILREVSLAVGTGVGRIGDLETRLPPGMIGGQVMDIESEGVPPTAELVEAIHRAKTGALITSSIVSGGLYSLLTHPSTPHLDSEMWIHRLRTFGQKAGLAFQIVDDVLDMTQSSAELGKTAGKDTASTKATWPAVFGIEQSLHDAQELIADAFAALTPFGEAAAPLKSLAQYLVERKH